MVKLMQLSLTLQCNYLIVGDIYVKYEQSIMRSNTKKNVSEVGLLLWEGVLFETIRLRNSHFFHHRLIFHCIYDIADVDLDTPFSAALAVIEEL